MFENIDEFLLCRTYVGIWALVVYIIILLKNISYWARLPELA